MELQELWERYMGRDISPEEYEMQGEVTVERLAADLRDLWASHPTDALTDEQIYELAEKLSVLFE